MSRYMLLLYSDQADGEEEARRAAELPLFLELHASLREAGLLEAVQPLRGADSATSVRVREGQTELTDGPFAVTKESLVGYYILECADLDEALKQAARVPLARYGTIEVRPMMPGEEWMEGGRAAGAVVPEDAVNDVP
jgi:hypothetical protein